MSASPVFREASVVLRPPRVALLFRGGDAWRKWARTAISAASKYWGGSGWALIPYNPDGTVDDSLIPMIRAYDPDYVAILTHDSLDWYRVEPESLVISDDLRASADVEDQLVQQSGAVNDPAAIRAAEQILALTSCLAYANFSEDRPHQLQVPASGGDVHALVRVPQPNQEPIWGACAASPIWQTDLALYAASRSGYVPNEPTTRPAPSDSDLLGWLIDPIAMSPPESMLWYSSMEYSDLKNNPLTWYRTVSPELGEWLAGYSQATSAIVIGDTQNDFALAVGLERLLGWSLWLGTEDVRKGFDWRVRSILANQRRRRHETSPIPVTSTSVSAKDLEELAKLLNPIVLDVTSNSFPISAPSPSVEVGTPDLRKGKSILALSQHIGDTLAVPMIEDEAGSATSQVPIAAPVPDPVVVNHFGLPSWIVDVAFHPETSPPGRGLEAKWLIDSQNTQAPVMLRASRGGVSYLAGSHGIVLAGSSASSRRATPRLRQLSLRSWIEAKATAAGFTTTLSRAGQHASLMAARLGHRDRLIELVSGPVRAALKAFATFERPQTTSEAFPQADGVVFDGRIPYLTFGGFRRLCPDLGEADLRDRIDEMLSARILRQGLALGCKECNTPSFAAIDEIRQNYRCGRCGSKNALTRAAWRTPPSGPEWYFDLHVALRGLMTEDGDVPLLAARKLVESNSQTSTVEETNFSRGGEVQFEIDLIAWTNSRLIVLEAKSATDLGSGAERTEILRKRFKAAELLRADAVVFATSAQTWTEATRRAGEAFGQRNHPGIALEWMDGLG